MAPGYSVVRDLMSERVVSVGPDATVGEAYATLQKHGIHEVPVVSKDVLKGWVSYDQLLKRQAVPNEAKVTAVMETPPRVLADDDLIAAAVRMIGTHARALPVVDAKGKVVGIISRTDMLKAALETKEVAQRIVESAMTQTLEVAPEEEDLDRAEARLRKLHVNQLLVVDAKGKLAGYVSVERITGARHKEDLKETSGGRETGTGAITRARGQPKKRSLTVGSLAQPAPTVTADKTLRHVIQTMQKQGTTFVAVVDGEGFPVGIVSRADIIQLFAARREEEGVLVQIAGLGDGVDQSVYDQIYSKAQTSLKKVASEFDVEFLSLHYKGYHAKNGGDVKYSLTAHLSTQQQFLVAKADEWDALKATDMALDVLERRVREAKERRLDRRKGGPRRAAAFYT